MCIRDSWEDADEYIQSIVIARSLLKCKGFNHVNIVKSLRSNPNAKISHFGPGGLKLSQLCPKTSQRKGAIWKLLESGEDEYISVDGLLDGAAMRTLPLAAAFGDDMNRLVIATNRVSRITHASIESRLAAILVALRFRQIIFNIKEDHKGLLNSIHKAVKILGAENNSGFFLERCELATKIIELNRGPEKTLLLLIRNIGMKHYAWSTPISAVFWSYVCDSDFVRWLPPREKRIREGDVGKNFIQGTGYICYNGELIVKSDNGQPLRLSRDIYSEALVLSDSSHVKKISNINPNDERILGNDRAMDVDTFFSIAYSLCAADTGIEQIYEQAKSAANLIFNDDLMQISKQLLQMQMSL